MIEEEHESAEELAVRAMALNGITCVPVNCYLVDGYRYSTLADAMAQARRGGARRVGS
jgi:hypothetical protein